MNSARCAPFTIPVGDGVVEIRDRASKKRFRQYMRLARANRRPGEIDVAPDGAVPTNLSEDATCLYQLVRRFFMRWSDI